MNYRTIATLIRKNIVKMHLETGMSHIGSSLSCVDILVALYFGIMKKKSKNFEADRFILSKGHAVSALYAVLAQKGYFSKDRLCEYCRNGAKFLGHVTRDVDLGVEVSSGSLGHGLSIGAGMALAGKRDGLKHRVFVLMGDGECNEGSVWEAFMFARHHGLDNLIAIVDMNHLQAFGKTEDVIDLSPLKDRFSSFGCFCKEVNGHKIEEMIKVLKLVPFAKARPSVLLAHTTKGKGISFMEDKIEWHYRSPNFDQAKAALDELNQI